MLKNHPHPGELLREDVLNPLGLEVTEAAHRLGVARTTLSRVLHGHAGISPNLALRLEKAGVSTARFWMALQANYELSRADNGSFQEVKPLQERPNIQPCRHIHFFLRLLQRQRLFLLFGRQKVQLLGSKSQPTVTEWYGTATSRTKEICYLP